MDNDAITYKVENGKWEMSYGQSAKWWNFKHEKPVLFEDEIATGEKGIWERNYEMA